MSRRTVTIHPSPSATSYFLVHDHSCVDVVLFDHTSADDARRAWSLALNERRPSSVIAVYRHAEAPGPWRIAPLVGEGPQAGRATWERPVEEAPPTPRVVTPVRNLRPAPGEVVAEIRAARQSGVVPALDWADDEKKGGVA